MQLSKSCNASKISSCGPLARTISKQLTLQGIRRAVFQPNKSPSLADKAWGLFQGCVDDSGICKIFGTHVPREGSVSDLLVTFCIIAQQIGGVFAERNFEPLGATEVRQVQACDSTRSACSHKKRTGTHGMGDRRRCNFLSHAFCHPLTTFGVLVIFFAYPGVPLLRSSTPGYRLSPSGLNNSAHSVRQITIYPFAF